MHSVLEQRKHSQKQHISIGRTVVWGCAETLPWFPPGNLSCHHPRACCFYHLVVFLGSCLLWCSVLRCLLRLIGSLRTWLRRQDSLPPGPRSSYDSLSLCSSGISVSLWHFARGQETFTKRMNLTRFTDIVKSGKIGVQLKIDTCILKAKKHIIVPTSALMIVLFTLVSCPGMLSNCKQCGKNCFWAIMFVLSLLAFKMALTTRRLAEVKVYFSLLYDDWRIRISKLVIECWLKCKNRYLTWFARKWSFFWM